MHNLTRVLAVSVGILGLAVALANACSAERGSTDGSGTSTGGPTGGSSAGGSGVGGYGFGGIGASAGNGGLEPCAEVSSEAQEIIQPADIIIAVDTSGSMEDEAEWTQDNMNDFVSAIMGSGVDTHVVMISSDDICVPFPLGSGSCPADESLPAYRHVAVSVGSNDALKIIVQTYDQWKDSLRPEAHKTIAVISDDNSTEMSGAEFTSALLTADPTFLNFKFDAIVSYENPVLCVAACTPSFCIGCGKCCPLCVPLSAAEGVVYKQLVATTGGVMGDLCDQDFEPVFQDMATAVIAQSLIACVYDIPEPEDGGTINPDKVNVNFIPSPGDPPVPLYNVPGGEADCNPSTGGWYYDDPVSPTKILLCPSTCAMVQASPDGKVVVVFGCDTIVAPPD